MADLELIVDPDSPALADRFFRAGADLLELLDELAELPTEWMLTGLRLGSAVAVISAPEGGVEGDRPLRAAVSGLLGVSTDGPLPDDWNPSAVVAARKFAHNFNTAGNEPVRGRLRLVRDVEADSPVEAAVEIQAVLAQRLDDLQPFTRSMPGSVRGQLVGLNISRGNRASLRTIGGRVVRVGFGSELRIDLKDALYKHIELVGAVSQDADGRVFHIRAETVHELPVPTLRWSELYGYEPNITGGRSVAEYLEETRGQA